MENKNRNILIWAAIGLGLLVLFNLFQGNVNQGVVRDLAMSDLYQQIEDGNVNEALVEGKNVSGTLKSGEQFQAYISKDSNISEVMMQKGVKVRAGPKKKGGSLLTQILVSTFPILLIIAVWVFFFRQMQGGGGGGKAMGFGKSRAKLLNEQKEKVTFEDVAGIDEAQQELEEIVDFLKDSEKFTRLGGQIPKGALLVGPPGTGKTLLARAIAGEANVPFFSISGSDFVEMFVGVGASRVRDMFEQAKKSSPCIIFIDEIDAVGRHRGAGLGGGNDEREQTLNQLLVEMDGFSGNEGIILIAATNRPDVLDPALLRPGRFDRQIVVALPDLNGREKILKVHMRNVPLAPDVNPRVVARGTPGFSGADLKNLVNESALLAARKNRRVVSMAQFEEAKDKVMMGVERRTMAMSEDEKKLTAYHESGHALVAIKCPASDPIHKATIIPRGRALGLVMRLPENDRVSMSREKLEADLAVAMGGRVAEEIIFGHDKVTTGASSDIQMATNISRRMVTEWGLSDELGPLKYGEEQGEVFLGHSVTQTRSISEDTMQRIDKEVKRIVDESYERAQKILTDNLQDLHAIAQALLTHETLSGDEIKAILAGEEIERPNDDTEGVVSTTIPTTAPAVEPKPAKKTAAPKAAVKPAAKKKTAPKKKTPAKKAPTKKDK